MLSDAVNLDYYSRTLGYKIKRGDFAITSPNLPQRITIYAEANTANQATLDTTYKEITSTQQAGEVYGFGSPVYQIMRILRPVNGGSSVGGIKTIVSAQESPVGATARVLEITPTGVATKNGVHTLKIAGRSGLDGRFYNINIEKGDDTSDITSKIEDVINKVLGCPVSATSTDYEAIATTKWKGLTANDVSIEIDTNDVDLGITYSVAVTASGSGTPDISTALSGLGNAWTTLLVNSYGTVSSVMDALEATNGIPDDTTPTGRYAGIIMKPLIAITGSTEDDPSSITDSRKLEVTIAIAPAPLSKGLPMEAAANMTNIFARLMQNTPNGTVGGKYYPDMPTPESIGSMADYDTRNSILEKGCSTVDLVAGRYQVQDFVTTYHKDGEIPLQFNYCRNLMIDFNIRYTVYLKEVSNLLDKSIALDSDIVTASNVIKPKQWIQILNQVAEDLTARNLIVEVEFMKDSIQVQVSDTNPNRLETFFKYKRSSVVRIGSTTVEAGFYYGTSIEI